MKSILCLAIAVLGTLAAGMGAPAEAAEAAAKPYLTLETLRAKYADGREGRFATIGGVEAYYRDEGRGPAMLLIHGSRMSLLTWDKVAAAFLERGYRVIRYDLPPLGLSGSVSDEAAARLTPAAFAAGLLDHIGVDRVTCVGVSSGGTTCTYLAATYPDRVTRLILSNSPSDPVDGGIAKLTRTATYEKALREAQRTGFRSQDFWNAFLDFYGGDPRSFDSTVREQYYDFNRRTPEKNPIALIGQVSDPVAARAAMARVRVPTLLIWGARDPLLPPPAAKVLEDYLENAQVSKVFMPDVGHYPPVEAPARFAQLILTYLEAAAP